MIYKSEIPSYWMDLTYYFGTSRGWLIKDGTGYALVVGDDEHLDECIITDRFADEVEALDMLRHEADFFTHEEPPENWKLAERTQKWWDKRVPFT